MSHPNPPEPEVKPCPMCGETELEKTKSGAYYCPECDTPNEAFSEQAWNGAYCWRELAQMREKYESTEGLQYSYHKLLKYSDSLRQENADYREALEMISDCKLHITQSCGCQITAGNLLEKYKSLKEGEKVK